MSENVRVIVGEIILAVGSVIAASYHVANRSRLDEQRLNMPAGHYNHLVDHRFASRLVERTFQLGRGAVIKGWSTRQLIVNNRHSVYALFLLLFLSATNRWMGFADGVTYLHAHDVESYLKIAETAPSLPTEHLKHHFGQRLITHYVVGTFSRATGAPLSVGYRLAWAGLSLALVFASLNSFAALRMGDGQFRVATAVLLLNPYSLRYYALVPGMAQDLVFALGCVIMLGGLFRRQDARVLAGAAVAALGRQTAMTLLPGLLVWMWAGDGWRERPSLWRIGRIGGVIGTVVIIYAATGFIAGTFSLPSENVRHLTGIFDWSPSAAECGIKGLGEHSLRIFIPFAIPTALMMGTARWVGYGCVWTKPEFIACVALAGGVSAQPFLAGPAITGANASRLSALGLIFSVGALAIALRNARPRSAHAWVPLVAIAMGSSFHHVYTVVGPATAAGFAVIQLGFAVAAGVWAYLNYEHGALPDRAGSPREGTA